MTKWLKNSISFRYFLPWLMVTLADVFAVDFDEKSFFSETTAVAFHLDGQSVFLP